MTQEANANKNPYNISSLRVEIGAAKVEIRFGEEFSLTVSDNTHYESTVENGTWIIRGKPEGMRWMLGEQTTRYLISLPHGTALDALILDIGAGLMFADGLQAQTAKLKLGAGKMDLQHLSVAGACTADVGAGKMDLKETCVGGPCSASVGAGMLTLSGALAGRNKIVCSMGMADFRLARPADYGYRAQCAMGSIKVDTASTAGVGGNRVENESAATFYDIECGMGSVNVQFC